MADRGEVDKQSIQPTCHVAAPKLGNLLIRTLLLAQKTCCKGEIL
ncbi:hypothetical protein HMPREF0305_10125 [Corynebacterium pseudogenitalium ATCC 33035]|uniref:Uncharacterized protein n=1 Tax=Corynebacterium pseudogenitalium ATCC 33035 TaxID=525264 RepID=E2S0S3_9CORY|nr:hypothetical protein HMPREF0305_10125 [Corynebacterium pseudogenitalium ATCC 33035]